ncbi:hypothetical protein GCM10010172_86650 [Paractinoplanes ferrugineus]|uniref:SMI1/KNR4 family protein n=1 Tax=Paractinoplanes ferrugineus TaxID=113564 RepID=A0A919MCV2_9ACTN|nr:hypothetical protein [Actinoplanes ferrugineus]GIE15121.1 hypothetical protein Afe05nite_69610 [Actinoplanes ferrugineus]
MTAAELLAASGRFPIAAGLSESELSAIEHEFGFTFAPDHREFLAAGLPAGRGWPDWRSPDRAALRERLAWPVEGVIFDVAENKFWYEGWGPQPDNPVAAMEVAKRYLVTAPRMISVHSHCYLPAAIAGHPVLSVYQTDVAHYGNDLSDWLSREFALGAPAEQRVRATVPFWRDLL